MHLSHIILALLPALALAQDAAGPTSSQPVTLTKTITLARAHATASQAITSGAAASTGTTAHTSHTSAPTTSLVPVSGAAGLEAGKFALAGVAGMIVVALM
ncbi:hypothetical protein ESCO_004079 [Escovopsis weberi]|uniref:Uncharacterized protein n=1 Tax=Escovopsis weberi TaxID=150374 RepID=A0A0M8N6P2_ESCWE|nr:hypothetical protein ESCO_004079 [Escovopsis weberi]